LKNNVSEKIIHCLHAHFSGPEEIKHNCRETMPTGKMDRGLTVALQQSTDMLRMSKRTPP
jgi:hypothetical protein